MPPITSHNTYASSIIVLLFLGIMQQKTTAWFSPSIAADHTQRHKEVHEVISTEPMQKERPQTLLDTTNQQQIVIYLVLLLLRGTMLIFCLHMEMVPNVFG